MANILVLPYSVRYLLSRFIADFVGWLSNAVSIEEVNSSHMASIMLKGKVNCSLIDHLKVKLKG
jgi:hypothetical protein